MTPPTPPFHAISPLFDTAPFTVNGRHDGGKTLTLWAANPAGELATTAEVVLV